MIWLMKVINGMKRTCAIVGFQSMACNTKHVLNNVDNLLMALQFNFEDKNISIS